MIQNSKYQRQIIELQEDKVDEQLKKHAASGKKSKKADLINILPIGR